MALLALLRRRIWLVAPVALATFATAAYQIYRDPPTYRATAVLRLSEPRQPIPRLPGEEGRLEAGIADWPSDPGLSLVQLLRTRRVAREVVEKEGLRLQVLPKGFPEDLLHPGTLRDTLLRRVHVGVSPTSDTIRIRLNFSENGLTVRSGRSEVRAAYGDPVELERVRFTVAANPGIPSADLAVIPPGEAITNLLEDLEAEPRENTDIVDVHYSASDPVVAQRVVNSALEAFQKSIIRTAQEQATQRRRFIEEQVRKSDSLLSAAESELNAFRSRIGLYSPRDRLLAEQEGLTGLELRRSELAADRRMYGNLLAAITRTDSGITSGERLDALVSAPGIAENQVVAQLYTRLTAYQSARDSLTAGLWAARGSHPDVKRLDQLVSSTEDKIATAVRGHIATLDARLSALDELKARSDSQMSALPKTEGDLQQLAQRVETYRRTADLLRQKLQEAQIDEADAGTERVEVVDPADVPTRPVGGSRPLKLMFGLLLGIFLGGAGAYFFENRRIVFRRQKELETALRIPNLALIPRLNVRKRSSASQLPEFTKNGEVPLPSRENWDAKASPELVTLSDQGSIGAEAYRMLRTNLLFSASREELKTVLVTSATPQEGKTTTAANLAVICAKQGYRVLLVDCDLRRARIHHLFQVPQHPGFTQLLQGYNVPAEVVRAAPVEHLSILPAGNLPPNPSELVASPGLSSVMDALAGMFDLIIVDAPPVLLTSEAGILSRQVDGVLLVVRAGYTERELAQRAAHQLTLIGARVIGTVFNDPDAEEAEYDARYGYSYPV